MGDSKGESYFIAFRNFKTFDHLLKLAENNLREEMSMNVFLYRVDFSFG